MLKQNFRHILSTVVNRNDQKVNFYIYETNIEVIARQILLLLIISEPDSAYGLNAKTSLYLDVTGNSLLRPATEKYLKQKSIVLSEMVSDFGYCKKRAPFLNLEKLKFKGRGSIIHIYFK